MTSDKMALYWIADTATSLAVGTAVAGLGWYIDNTAGAGTFQYLTDISRKAAVACYVAAPLLALGCFAARIPATMRNEFDLRLENARRRAEMDRAQIQEIRARRQLERL